MHFFSYAYKTAYSENGTDISESIDHSSIAIKVSLSKDFSICKKKFGLKLHVTSLESR